MATTVRFDAKAQKIIVEIDASKAAFDAAPASSTGKTRLLASAGNKIGVNTPSGQVNLAINAMVPNKG